MVMPMAKVSFGNGILAIGAIEELDPSISAIWVTAN
jgi:hypothetical protein